MKIQEQLPFDIVTDILSYLSVKVLLKFKCVCKKWHDLIEDESFLDQHVTMSNKVGYFYRYVPHSDIIESETFKCIAGYRGLQVEKNNTSQKYRVKNPATRHIFVLPDLHEDRYVLLVYVHYARQYKVVAYNNKGDFSIGNIGGVEVFTLGVDEHSWRSLTVPNFKVVKNITKKQWCFPNMNDLHCVVFGSNMFQVFSLDLGTECFTVTTSPPCLFPDLSQARAINCHKLLAVAYIVNDELNLFVLEDYKKQQWEKRKITLTFLQESPIERNDSLLLSADGWLHCWLKNREELLLYHIETKVRIIRKDTVITLPRYDNQDTLITFKGMLPEKD